MADKSNKPKRVRRFKSERIAKMSAHDISRISDERLRRLNTREAFELSKRVGELVWKRMTAIEKKGLTYMAGAERYLSDQNYNFMAQPETRAQAIRDIAHGRQFFGAKSSTVKGIERILKEQDDRLSKLAGKKISFSSEQARTDFWKAYQEFLHQHTEFDNQRDSDRIQRFFAEAGFWRTRGYPAEDLELALEYMKARSASDLASVHEKMKERYGG